MLLTLLNALKPLYIDDPFIHDVARQMADRPTNPYGFEIFWMQWPQPVHEELTPPVLPYWWSLALRLFGERPLAWKLWLFPFSLLLSVSLHELLRRYAPKAALPLVVMTVLSPAVLPSLNLMQDIPALALGLTGLAIYLRAADRGSDVLALCAGLACGLAAQTKYPTLTLLVAILLHGVLFRRLRLALLAAATAAVVFAGWEWLMTLLYGQGMLAGQLGNRGSRRCTMRRGDTMFRGSIRRAALKCG